jgi:DUF971 family protein
MTTATDIRLERGRRVLVVSFDDGQTFELPCSYLRTHSPSAEVRGHGFSEPALMTGVEAVNIERIIPVGSYAVQLHFDDGHNTGIYSWPFLHELGVNMSKNLARYQERLAAQQS